MWRIRIILPAHYVNEKSHPWPPGCSAVPQPSAPPRATWHYEANHKQAMRKFLKTHLIMGEKLQQYQLDNFFFFDVLLTVHLSIFTSAISQLDAQIFCFTISLFNASTCFEHICSSSGGQNCITPPLVSSHLQVVVSCAGWKRRRSPIGVMIPEAV